MKQPAVHQPILQGRPDGNGVSCVDPSQGPCRSLLTDSGVLHDADLYPDRATRGYRTVRVEYVVQSVINARALGRQ